MALEHEIKQMLWRHTTSHPKALEALTGLGTGASSTEDLFTLILRKQEALEQAVLRVAREVDKLAGTGEGDE
jgi:hypothetical protein